MSALDIGARQLAAQARREGVRANLIAKLARGITQGRMATLSTAPPAIGSPSATSTVPGSVMFEAPTHAARFTFLRATWAAGTGFPLSMVMIPEAVGTNSNTARNGGAAPLVRFWSDAPILEIVNRTGSGGYRLRIDGSYATTGVVARRVSATFLVHTPIDWAGVRRMRLYEIEGEADLSFAGVRIPATSALWPAPPGDDDLRIVVHGDSFVETTGAGTSALHGALAACLPQLLGQPDTRGSGLGSTGFLNAGTGGRVRFIDRVQSDVIAPAPQVVIELGGINDRDLVLTNIAAMQAAVTAWLDRVQVALPNALIFMTGPMSPNSSLNTDSSSIAIRNAKAAACAGRRGVAFIDNLAEAWVTGSGRVGAATGNGSADWVTSADGTHPSDEGHRYLAERVVRAIAARLGTL